MLEFWYSERCNRQLKLIIIIAVCIVIYIASTVTKLGSIFVGISLAIGMLMHVLREFRLKLAPKNPYAEGFRALTTAIPIVVVISLIGYLPKTGEIWETIALGLQCLGFVAIGLFILSIYNKRAKRFED
ncbi:MULTISPECIES: hypothetical protein [Acinetobacter]|uniref:hypothetical protein n=1 Tax=Acinetobacter TaxID=469 RepID=UPI0015D1B611|nr:MULTISPECIES: hypothetical protein [Acinetobacter]UNW06648.1 hypothetical protein MOV98_14530 [Acinetobacter variabilis]WKT72879.1 hypothetical protein Q3F87_13800 [Acinetobacter variabilis]